MPDHHERARSVLAQMSEEERLWCLDGDAPFWAGVAYLSEGGYHRSPFPAAKVERLGLPGVSFSDGPRGIVVDRSTCFPVSMARGATWDLELEERIGEAMGRELRAVGADLFGGICVNLLRHPAWGRAQETYGEDPHHVGELGAAMTRGVQRHAMACVKHFCCNSMENARFKVDVDVSEEALHDVYLPQFKRIVDEGVACVMSAYNSVNGDWCAESTNLLTDVLRGEWGFDGFVISDWIFGLRDAARSVRAGLDVEMPYRMLRADHLEESIRLGKVGWDQVDLAVERVVATRMRFDEVLGAGQPGIEVLACPEHRSLAREAAAKSVVLLRNEPVEARPLLPLDVARLGSVALVGRLATEVNLGDGGSSDVWPPHVVTVYDGLRAALPGIPIAVDDGTDPGRAASLASGSEVTFVVVGYTCVDEGEFAGTDAMAKLSSLFPGPDDPVLVTAFSERIARRREVSAPDHVAKRVTTAGFVSGGDRKSLRLHPQDVILIDEVSKANPKTVVVIVGGSAVLMSEWDYKVPAVLQSWYSGMEGGHGLADVVLGRVDATGRLPFSVPTEEEHLPPFDAEAESFTYDGWHGWWHLERRGVEPAYPFGFGLSYTTLSVGDCAVAMDPSGLAVSATIQNTGSRPGADVVQVYAHRVGADSRSRMAGFCRVEVGAGESVRVDIPVPYERLAVRDVTTHEMRVVPGAYVLRVARHACDPGTTLDVAIAPEPAIG